jgi:chemotaxis family two-component system sensor histidine kinase/response regulator PixL
MIVDDSSALRRTLALTLRKAGYQVLQARDGSDALNQLQRGAMPSLIICDVEMPRLNGFEFLSQRRANSLWSQIPTIMLTSRGNHKHRTLAKHLGATDYFTKPYIEKEFVGAISNLLQQTP